MAVDEARVWTFGAAGLAAAAGLASFFASFTGPDGPAADVSAKGTPSHRLDMQRVMKGCVVSCEGAGPTFRLRKLALFNAGLEGLVEHGVKLCLGSELDLVVGLDVFLDRLATIEG